MQHEQVELHPPPLIVQDHDELEGDDIEEQEHEGEDIEEQEQEDDLTQKPPSGEKIVTRRVAKQQGLVYNKEKMLLEPQSTSDTIEALTRRSRLVRRRIRRKENYFIVEHVYQTQQVKPYIKINIKEEPTNVETEDKTETDPENEGSSDTQTLTPDSPETKTFDIPKIIITPPKSVRFDPNVQRQEFHTPAPTLPKRQDSMVGFAKEVIKSTADALFPPLKTEPYSPDSRPIRGTTKSYAEMFPDPLVKTEDPDRESKPSGSAASSRSRPTSTGQPPPVGQPPPNPEGTS